MPSRWQQAREHLRRQPGDFPLRGVFVEIGLAMGCDIPIFIVAPEVILTGRTLHPLGSWMHHPHVHGAETVEDALHTMGYEPEIN